jgi:hypothetical protein
VFIFTYTAAILAVTCVCLAVLILIFKKRDLLARYLGYYSLVIGFWVGANALADVATTPQSLIFWSGIALGMSAISISLYLAFVYIFIHRRKPGWKQTLMYFGPASVFVIGAFSEYSVKGTIFPLDAPTQILPGVLYEYLPIFLFSGLLYGSIQLAVLLRKNPGAQRRMQIMYMEAGFLIVFVGGVIFSLILPLMGELRFFSVGPQFSIFFVAFSAYAVLKHRLIDIKVVIQRSVIFSLLLFVTILFYLFTLYFTLLFNENINTRSYLIASLVTTMAGIFGIPPLKNFFKKTTDRFFFKQRLVYSEAVEILSQVLNKHLDLLELQNGIIAVLKNIFRLEFVKLAALEHDLKLIDDPVRHDDSKESMARRIEAKIPGEIKTMLFRCDGYEHQLNAFRDEKMIEQAEVILPAILMNKLVALIALGPKLSEDPYFQDDIDLLKSFSYQAAVAIEKAKLHKEVQRRSDELEEQYRERTDELKNLKKSQSVLLRHITQKLQVPIADLKVKFAELKNYCSNEEAANDLKEVIDNIAASLDEFLKITSSEENNCKPKPKNAKTSSSRNRRK